MILGPLGLQVVLAQPVIRAKRGRLDIRALMGAQDLQVLQGILVRLGRQAQPDQLGHFSQAQLGIAV